MDTHNITTVLNMSRTMVLCSSVMEALVFDCMKYGQRLKTARDYAKLSQAGLAERAKVGTQENVSKLERGEADGSEFTVQYAIACEINPIWLATGEGDMMDVLPYSTDPWITRVVKAMQHMKEEDERYLVITSEALVEKGESGRTPAQPKESSLIQPPPDRHRMPLQGHPDAAPQPEKGENRKRKTK